MAGFEVPAGLTVNRGPVADPEGFAREVGAASWLFLCGEEFSDSGTAACTCAYEMPPCTSMQVSAPVRSSLPKPE